MAFSSPGQPRDLDPMDQMPLTGSLSDIAGGSVHGDGGAEIPFEQRDPTFPVQPSSQLGPQHEHSTQADFRENTADYTASNDTMLLEKPSTLSRSLDLDKGYEYGPAVQFAPGFFTKIQAKQAPIHQNQQPQPLKNDQSPRSDRASRSSRSRFPSPNCDSAEATTGSHSHPTESTDQPQAAPLVTAHTSVTNWGKKPERVATPRTVTQTTGKPPFPDTSLKEPTRPVVQTQAARVEGKPVSSLPREDVRPQVAALRPGVAEELVLGQGSHISPRRAQGGHHTILPHGPPGYDRQIPHEPVDNARNAGLHDTPLPTLGVSGPSLMDAAHRTRNHVANRPLRAAMNDRPTRPVHRARPESRSSNVSKQKSVQTFPALSSDANF